MRSGPGDSARNKASLQKWEDTIGKWFVEVNSLVFTSSKSPLVLCYTPLKNGMKYLRHPNQTEEIEISLLHRYF